MHFDLLNWKCDDETSNLLEKEINGQINSRDVNKLCEYFDFLFNRTKSQETHRNYFCLKEKPQ